MLKKALVTAAAVGLTLAGAATAQASTQAAWPPPNTNGTYKVSHGAATSNGTWRHWYELLFDSDHVEVSGKLTVTDNSCYYLMANKTASRVLCNPGSVDVKVNLTGGFVRLVVGPVDVKVCRMSNTGTPDGSDCGSAQRVNS